MYTFRSRIPIWLIAVVSSTLLLTDAKASYTLSAIDQGSVGYTISVFNFGTSGFTSPTWTHDPVSTQMIVNKGGSLWHPETRVAYAWFEVPNSSGEAAAATLQIQVAGLDTYGGAFGFPIFMVAGTIDLRGLALPYGAYQPSGYPAVDLWNDLNSGALYLSQSYADGLVFGSLSSSLDLPTAAVQALNAARGGYFGLGFAYRELEDPLGLGGSIDPGAGGWLGLDSGLLLSGPSLQVTTGATGLPDVCSSGWLLAPAALALLRGRRRPATG